MKLEKYEDKSKKKRKVILVSIGVIVLISVSLILYKTFASFSEEVSFPMMKGKVDYFGNSDIYFAFYKGNELLEEMPQKDNKENLVFDYGECDNESYIEWDNEEWAPLIIDLSKSKTKCSLYFKEKTSINICNKYGNDSALCYISKLGDSDYINMAYDHASANGVLDNNLRYIGASPNNYIDIGDRDGDGNPILWRIIGIMNNITSLDDEEKQESLIKIMRADIIGGYSWDSSITDINGGFGINEWSESDIMKLLNPKVLYTDNPKIGGSLYWNKSSGNCYSDSNEVSKKCDFTSSGISEEAKNKIAKVRWNIGTISENYDANKITAKYMYIAERSNHNGKELCENTNGNFCNDKVSRTTTWDGYVGLIYPSDFGYAVGDSIRKICLEKSMYLFRNEDCGGHVWFKTNSGYLWTMTPVTNLTVAHRSFNYNSTGGYVTSDNLYRPNGVKPTVYLKSNVKITGGTGEIGSPFIATLN